jgi:hypothetical protein
MHPASASEGFTLLKPALTVSKATTPCSTRNAVYRQSAAGPLAVLTHYILVPYRNRHPLSGPLYRLVATARSRGYHSGWLSAPAGPSDPFVEAGGSAGGLQQQVQPGNTRHCADRWALWATGRCATPTKTEHPEIPVGRGRPPRRPLLAEVSSLGPKDAHAMGTRLGAVARRPGPGEHRGRRRMPTAGEHKRP